MDSMACATVSAFWEAHCHPKAWNFVTLGLHNGDLYHFLSLIRPFKTLRAGGRPVRILTASRPHHELALLFADRVDEVVFTPIQDFTGLQICEWRTVTGRDAFAPGELINMLPQDYFRRPLQFGPVWFMLNERAIFLIHLMKLLLMLPLDIGPDLPIVTSTARTGAQALFQQYDMIEGRTLLLFPFQHSHPEGFRYTHACFATLAARAAASGLRVYTSVAPGEEPVDGTTGIFVPFGVLVPLCELAGYTVIWRSGISDILVTARCVKVGIYPTQLFLNEQSPIGLGLGGNERGIIFDFANHVDQEAFAEAVVSRLLGPDPTDGSPYIPKRIHELLDLRLRPDLPNGFFRREDFVVRHDWGRVFTSGVLAEGWSGLEPWGMWSQGYRSTLYLKPALPMGIDVAEMGGRRVVLLLDLVFAIAPDIQETLYYTIEVNADSVSYEARWPERGRIFRIPLPSEQLHAPLRVTFTVENPATTRALSGGKSDDDRLIGIGLGRAAYEVVSAA